MAMGKRLLLLSGVVLSGIACAGEDLGGSPGFSAQSLNYQEGNKAGAQELQVYLSPQGKRIEGIPPRGVTMIAPAEESKRWLVVERERVFAVDASREQGARLGGLLAHEPCQGFPDSERIGSGQVDGRETQKWKCTHPRFGEVTQWFDAELNTVIKDRSASGKIEELRDIRVGPQKEDLFRFEPGDDYQRVTPLQLF
ncbi:hypothetical protein AN478_06145 [Thiohalorhabdus denitrificans]|uniref:DUF4412 domain-containing protein n=1 Tax=Thiohalorhabdus denitrificans TaxID=381306 RepID=A0A0P9EPH6_9GAMM|nr:hypothetical protein [Thiohalorhabdus denitrificans]KPV40383.1 hypothetical protein AN478_06145 [Thiohalorhabdus denitrificans]SCY59160.1 hypothetical protein SAMN05661077_2592 [Thiohalorhabdus denitrificans]